MRFMMLVKSDEKTEKGVLPGQGLFEAMAKYNEELAKAGALLAADGLQPTSKGARITFQGPKRTVTDGPFPDATSLLAGFWIIEVKSKEEAIDWAKRIPFDEGVVEVRQLEELSDFPAEIQKAIGPSEEALRKQLEQRRRV